MWKVLLVISAVVLGGAAYLSWTNKTARDQKLDEVVSQKDLLTQRKASLDETNQEIAQLEQSIQMLKDEAEALSTEKINLDTQVVKAQSDLKTQEENLAKAKEKLEGDKTLVDDINKIEAIQRQMAQIRTQIEEAEIEVTQLEGAAVRDQVETDRFKKVAAELEALRSDQSAGLIRGEFQSEIAKAYNQWGFVVVEGGNDQGVVNRAQLDVYRRGTPICKLLVTSVEPSTSVAEIIAGSLAPGQTVQEGDTVVKTVRANTPVAPTTDGVAPGGTTAPPAETTAPPAGMESTEPDPFGSPTTMPPAETEPDPFGSAPAMEAPAETEPDPFGNPGAMEGGGGETEPNPFQ